MPGRKPLTNSEVAAFLTIATLAGIAIVLLFYIGLREFEFHFDN